MKLILFTKQESEALELYNNALALQQKGDYTASEEAYNQLLNSALVKEVIKFEFFHAEDFCLGHCYFLSIIITIIGLLKVGYLTCYNTVYYVVVQMFHIDIVQAPVVQRVYSAICWINDYPLDNEINFDSTYPLDSDLSSG